MRESTDEIRSYQVWNGFDYNLQVWVQDGIILDCNHPQSMKGNGCCKSHSLAGRNILLTPGAEYVVETILIDGICIRK